jgi:hypothetical protein
MELDDATVQKVWELGRATQERDPAQWREDECGAWMQREQLNNANSEFGWHIRNIEAGGGDNPGNLRPFHVENEYNLMAHGPECRITADRAQVAPTAKLGKPRNRST